MAQKFHINSKGEPGRCSAQHGGCPFGSESEHYATKESASLAYEQSMNDGVLPKLTKAPTRDQVEQVLDSMSRGDDTIPEGVEFVESDVHEIAAEPEVSESVSNLQNQIQEEIEWSLAAEEKAREKLKDAKAVVKHNELHFGKKSEAYKNAIDSSLYAALAVEELSTYRAGLEKDRESLNSPYSSITRSAADLSETIREKRLKKQLHDLQYDPKDGTLSLRELEEKIARPIRRDESEKDYQEYLRQAAHPKNDSDRQMLLDKDAEQTRLMTEINVEVEKRRAGDLSEDIIRWQAENEAARIETIRLLDQDNKNYKAYNSVANRIGRLFTGKKKILAGRSELSRLPLGRRLVDYDPTGKDTRVWIKIGEDKWRSDMNNFSGDNERRLPATVVE